MELKELLEELDIKVTEGASKEDVLNAIRGKYIAKELITENEEIVNKIFGKQAGTYETIVKRGLKALGIEDEKLSDFKLKDLKEREDEFFPAIAEKYNSKIEDLTKNAAKGNDKKVEELSTKLADLENKNKSLAEMLDVKVKEVEEVKGTFDNTIKSFKINQKLSDVKKGFQLSDSVNEYMQKGFEVSFNDKYKVELDEKDNLVILDKEGKPIENDKKSGFASFEDVYKKELSEAKMLKLNNGGNDPKPQLKPEPKQNNGNGFYVRTEGRAPIAG